MFRKSMKAKEWRFESHWPISKNKHISKWFFFGNSSITEFGGRRINNRRTLFIFGFPLFTIERREYDPIMHKTNEQVRADDYLKRLAFWEKKARDAERVLFGMKMSDEQKDFVRNVFGVDFDGGDIHPKYKK